MKTPDDSDDDGAGDDGDDEDFDGMSRFIFWLYPSGRENTTICRLRLRLRSRDGYSGGWTCRCRRSLCRYAS